MKINGKGDKPQQITDQRDFEGKEIMGRKQKKSERKGHSDIGIK